MTEPSPEPDGGLTPQRAALLRMHAIVHPELRVPLDHFGISVPDGAGLDDALQELQLAATASPDGDAGPQLPRYAVAQAALSLAADRRPTTVEELVPVAQRLMPPGRVDDLDAAARVANALIVGPDVRPPDRWQEFVQRLGPGRRTDVHPEIAQIVESSCDGDLVAGTGDRDTDPVARVDSRIVVEGVTDLEPLARALVPANWPRCNDFFSSLRPRPDLDAAWLGVAAIGGGVLLPQSQDWRGVYEERCVTAGGWFPDTFLGFSWERRPQSVILRYVLPTRLRTDRTVLDIDQGYVQVHRAGDRCYVTLVKYVRFDKARMPSGGQWLGVWACALGWVDYASSMLTDCAAGISPVPGSGAAGPAADILSALDDCERHLRELAVELDTRTKAAAAKLRDGDYDGDAAAADFAAGVGRALHHGARSVQDQGMLAYRTAELAGRIVRLMGGPRG